MSDEAIEWVGLLEIREWLVEKYPHQISEMLNQNACHGLLKIRLRKAQIVHGIRTTEEEDYVVDRASDLRLDQKGRGNIAFQLARNELSLQTGDVYPRTERRVSGVGISFDKAGLIEVFGSQIPTSPFAPTATANAEDIRPATLTGTGARIRKDDWIKFAAAFAAVASKEGLEVGTSAASIYNQVAQLLAVVDREGASPLSEDSVRDAITRAQEWQLRWPIS